MMAEVFLSDRAAHEVRGSKTVGATNVSVFAGTVWKKVLPTQAFRFVFKNANDHFGCTLSLGIPAGRISYPQKKLGGFGWDNFY